MSYEDSLFYGRYIVCNSDELIHLPQDAKVEQAIKNKTCGRCQSKILNNWQLPDQTTYCWMCAKLGTITSNDYLVTIAEPNKFDRIIEPCVWQGELTALQQEVANQQIKALNEGTTHLTYAVTGAGKTEMMFPMLTQAIKQGKRIAVVSPRVDVVIELYKRIKAAFSVPTIALYANSDDQYHYTQLVIATTHQLIHFNKAFDVMVIDETDAFPYSGNKFLESATQHALKSTGVNFYLTATLNYKLRKFVKKNNVVVSILPRRFHGQPLPNLTLSFIKKWRTKLPNKLIKHVLKLKKLNIKFLLFVPEIKDVQYVMTQLINCQLNVLGTYSSDNQRLEKVQKMREGSLDGLITTTILERGVTFPGIDVVILGGDESIFTTTALIQIAGRCGRSLERPTGTIMVYLCEKNRQIVDAMSEINYLNMLGKKYEM